MMTAEQTAEVLGRSRAWFYSHRAELESIGFPRPHPILRLYDRRLVEGWLDDQAGLCRNPPSAISDVDAAFGL